METPPVINGEVITDDEYIADQMKTIALSIRDRFDQLYLECFLYGGPVHRETLTHPDRPRYTPPLLEG